MSTTKQPIDDGGYAFPQPMASDREGVIYCANEKGDSFAGMTLREWYAGMALSNIATMTATIDSDWAKYKAAELAVAYADSLIAQLKKK